MDTDLRCVSHRGEAASLSLKAFFQAMRLLAIPPRSEAANPGPS